MRIVITGAGFRGKGGEAMLRTVQSELADRLHDVEFNLWRCPPGDYRAAFDAGFAPLFWPEDRQDYALRMASTYLLPAWAARQLSLADAAFLLRARAGKDEAISRAYRRYLERTGCSIDAVIDVSGFAYGDAWSLDRVRRNWPLVEYCVTHRVPMIYLPQAWGSFERSEIREAVKLLLDVAETTCYSRDRQSSRYLEELLGRPDGSIAHHPDIAFAFRGGGAEEGKQLLRAMGCSLQRPIVGIAPNMKIYRRAAGGGGGNRYVQTLLRLVEHCLRDHDVDIVLQASEMEASGPTVDDRYLCAIIAAEVNQPQRCHMTRETLTAGQTAAMISQFDYLVGSRFHSLVLGLAQGVPAMAISWSHKYRELLSSFGLEADVHEFQELDVDAVVATFEQGWTGREAARPRIANAATTMCEQVAGLFDDVAATIVSTKAV